MSNNKENQTSSRDMPDFESNSIALYNQQIIQILCSDTLELEIELARDLRQSSFEIASTTLPLHDTTSYSVWVRLLSFSHSRSRRHSIVLGGALARRDDRILTIQRHGTIA